MRETGISAGRWLSRGVPMLAGLGMLAWAGPADATVIDPDPPADVTFTRDIAPILQQNCQVCHMPGSIAPMSLITYDEVRPWARVIKLRVENRRMPPFHIDSNVGIQQFKNDRRLSDEDIATIVAWVDAGAPEGEPSEMPAPVTFPTGDEWQRAADFGPPDLVVKTTPYTVGATGEDAWWRPTVPTNIQEARWIRAVETKPSLPGRAVTHHVLSSLVQEEDDSFVTAGPVQEIGGLLTEWAIGKVGEIYPEDTGKLILPGSKIRFEVHYNPSGEEVVNDQVSLGLWFYPEGQSPKYRTTLELFNVSGRSTLAIPPNSVTTSQNFHVIKDPVRLESFQPHMHMRGKGMKMEAIYPNGERELLSSVSNFDWRWHVNYIYDEDVAPLLPVGTVLVFTSWHDNTASNPFNPDPNQFVTYGDRTVDEMSHAWVAVTHLTQEDFDRMVAEREAATGEKLAFDTDGGRR